MLIYWRRIEGDEWNQRSVKGTRERLVLCLTAIMVMVIFTPLQITADETASCCDSESFDLYLLGEPDNGELTPFDSELDEEETVEVTSSIFGEVQIGTWSIEWGQSGQYASGQWTFSIPYEVIDSTGVSGNATVLLNIGGNTYESSADIPAVYLTGSGELQVPVDVQDGEFSKNDEIQVTFSMRSLIFSSPGGSSGVNFFWGSEESDASLSMSFPLVSVEIREASVRGELVFFPVRLTSGFGDRFWTASTGSLFVQNKEITESPIVNSNEDWVDVTFVWNPDDFGGGSVRADFQITPQRTLTIEVDKMHEITLGQNTGDNSWYPEEEPPRTGGSDLEVIIDCDYDGNSIERDTTIRFEGAMSQWMRWGLDNIGNKSLGSNSWWRSLSSYSESVSSSEKQNGRVDNSEQSALENHLRGSKSDLKSFLTNGLMVNPDSIFGTDPVEFGPMEVTIDFGASRAFNSEKISIRISSSYFVDDDSRQTLIEDFVRPGGYDYWDAVSLSFEIRTGMLSGFGGVSSDNEDVRYTHRRWIVMEVLSVEESEIQSDMDYRIEFVASNSLLFSPLISAVISVFALVMAIGVGMTLTKSRSRAPTMMMVGVLGVLSLSIYWFGLPMPIVLGVVASSVLLVFPAAMISPKNDSDMPSNNGGGRVRCPSCGKKNRVESNIRPLRIECYGCNSTLRIE